MIISISILIKLKQKQQKMRPKVLILICLLVLVILAERQGRGRGENRGHKPKWGKNKKSRDEILIQKCRNVTCEMGRFCHNGFCKKIDYQCINKKCGKGFRCNKGQCVKQMCQPQKQYCVPLGFDKPKLHCGQQQRLRCSADKTRGNICGFTWGGVFEDYANECIACLTHRIKHYYNDTCINTPKVCPDDQQCLNGICTKILNEEVYENNRLCNQNKDCKPNQICGGHKCIKKYELLAYLKTASEAGPIEQVI